MPGEGFAPGKGSTPSEALVEAAEVSIICLRIFRTSPHPFFPVVFCRREVVHSLARSSRRQPRRALVSAPTPSLTWLCLACTARNTSRRCTPGARRLAMAAHPARALTPTQWRLLASSARAMRASSPILPSPRPLAQWQSPSTSPPTPWPFTSRLQCRLGTPQIPKPRTRAAVDLSRSTATSAQRARREWRAHAERAAARAQAAGGVLPVQAKRLSGARARQRGSSHRQRARARRRGSSN